MSEPLFEYDDGQGRLLAVFGRDDGVAALQLRVASDPVPRAYCTITPGAATELVLAVYRGCGLPVPVITPRPDIGDLRHDFMLGALRMRLGQGVVSLAAGKWKQSFPPADVRRAAGFLVALADAAEALDPGHGRVTAVARLIATAASRSWRRRRPGGEARDGD